MPIIPGGPVWSPLGTYSGECWSTGCGYIGWVDSDYTIATAGNYYLEVGVTNWADEAYDSGLAVDGATVGGVPVGPSPTPEPSTLVLLGSALLGGAAAIKRRLAA